MYTCQQLNSAPSREMSDMSRKTVGVEGLVTSCVSYFSVAVMKCHDQGSSEKKLFILAYSYKDLESVMSGWREPSLQPEWDAELSHLLL